MAFYIGTDKVIEDTDATSGISTNSNLDKLQINGTDVLTHDGSTVTLKNVTFDDASEISINTDNITEGSTNLFFTDARARAAISVSNANYTLLSYSQSTGIVSSRPLYGGTGITITDEGPPNTGLHWELTADTDDVTEGTTNLYYTDARVSALLGGGGGTTYATQTYVDTAEADANTYTDTAISNLVDTAPATLDTLNELAAALGDDPAFATTVTNNIATKIGNVVEDTTPQLGGNLDLQTYDITTSESDFAVTTGTGSDLTTIEFGGFTEATVNGGGLAIGSSINQGQDVVLLGDIDFLSGGLVTGEIIGLWAFDNATSLSSNTGLGQVLLNGTVEMVGCTLSDSASVIFGNLGTANEVGLAVGTSSDARIHQLDSSGNTIFKLPATDGTANQVLKTDGAGDLSWVAQTSNTNTTYTAGNGLTLNTTEFEMSGSYTGSFTATGDITAYSDARLKRNVETISNPVDLVNCLRGVNFEKDGRHSTGVIAQEVEEFLPEVVHTDAEGMKSVAYGNISGLLIEAIKEQQKTIEHLQKQITDLQNKNS